MEESARRSLQSCEYMITKGRRRGEACSSRYIPTSLCEPGRCPEHSDNYLTWRSNGQRKKKKEKAHTFLTRVDVLEKAIASLTNDVAAVRAKQEAAVLCHSSIRNDLRLCITRIIGLEKVLVKLCNSASYYTPKAPRSGGSS